MKKVSVKNIEDDRRTLRGWHLFSSEICRKRIKIKKVKMVELEHQPPDQNTSKIFLKENT